MADIFREIVRMRDAGEKAAVATIVSTKGSTPQKTSAKMIIKEDGTIVGSVGGGCVEAQVWDEAKEVMKSGKSKVVSFDLTEEGEIADGLKCGGKMDVYIEPLNPIESLYIFGAGHVSLDLVRAAKLLGFRIIVIDDRESFANSERFPDADEIIVENFESVFEKLEIDGNSYIVILTRGHAYDEEVLENALKTDARYIGMIGSKVKIKGIYSNLKGKGVSEESINRVCAPIGVPIGSVTPSEIAISIAAQLVKVKRKKS